MIPKWIFFHLKLKKKNPHILKIFQQKLGNEDPAMSSCLFSYVRMSQIIQLCKQQSLQVSTDYSI